MGWEPKGDVMRNGSAATRFACDSPLEAADERLIATKNGRPDGAAVLPAMTARGDQ